MRVMGIVGWSGSGKTTLIEEIIPLIRARGLTVSTVKHAHHGFDIDRPGKDSFRHRQAGAGEVLVASNGRWALMHENAPTDDTRLEHLLTRLAPCDIVLVEGFKSRAIPKLEVWRGNEAGLIALNDPEIRAVVSVEATLPPGCNCPVIARNDTQAIAAWVIEHARRL